MQEGMKYGNIIYINNKPTFFETFCMYLNLRKILQINAIFPQLRTGEGFAIQRGMLV